MCAYSSTYALSFSPAVMLHEDISQWDAVNIEPGLNSGVWSSRHYFQIPIQSMILRGLKAENVE